MAAVDEIAVRLGLRTGQFKAALREAGAEVKTFAEGGAQHAGAFTESVHETTKAMRLLHHAIALGGIYEAVKGFYEMAIGYAEKHTEDTDHQTEAVRRFGEAMKDSGGLVSKVSVQVLGYINSLGEAMGELTAGLVFGFDQAAKARNITEEAEATIAEIGKKSLETKKEIAKLETENAALQTKRAEAEFDSLDAQTRQALLIKAISEDLKEAATLDENSLKFQTLKRDILTDQGRLIKANAEVEKEAEQDLEDWWKDFVGFMQKANIDDAEAAAKKKAAIDALLAQNQALTDESVRTAKVWEAGVQTIYEEKDGQELITAELREQARLAEMKKTATAAEIELMNRKGGSPLGLHNLGSLSTDSLMAEADQLKHQLDDMRAKFQPSFATPNVEADLGFAFLSSQISSIKSELSFRDQMSSFGNDRAAALRAFTASGHDALSFDQAFSQSSSWGAGQAQTNQQLAAVNNSLVSLHAGLSTVFAGKMPPPNAGIRG